MGDYSVLNATGSYGLNMTFSPLSEGNLSDSVPQNTSTASNVPRGHGQRYEDFNCGEGIMLFRFMVQVVLTVPVCLFGVCGNSLAFVVLCYQKQKVSTTLLLQALSIADIIILIMAIPSRSLRYMDLCFGPQNLHIYSNMFLATYPLSFTFRMINTWLTTFLTFDRWIAVCRPLHAQRLVTKRMSMIHMTIVIFAAIVISIPRWFEYRINFNLKTDMVEVHPTELATNKYYTIIYKIFFFLTMMYIIPMVTLLVLNTKLVRALKAAEQDKKVLRRSADMVKQNRNITAMVTLVVAAFLICNLLPFCSQILYSIEISFKDLAPTLMAHRRRISPISDLMLTINSAINFIIYCACSKKFRITLLSMFSCVKKSESKYLTKVGHSSNSGITYLSLTRSRSSSTSAHKSVERAQTFA